MRCLKMVQLCVVAAATMFGGVAWSGGGPGGAIVLDPSNLAQNTRTAVQTMQQISTQIRQYQLQFLQYQQMVKDIRGLNPVDLLRYVSPEAAATIRNLESARNDVIQLRDSLRTMGDRVSQRQAAAARAKLTVAGYIDYLRELRSEGNQDADKALRRDEEILRQVKERTRQIQDWDSKTQELVNNASGADMRMSSQLNVVATSVNQLLEFMVKNEADARAREADAAGITSHGTERKLQQRQREEQRRRELFDQIEQDLRRTR